MDKKIVANHHDVIKWKHLPRYWPFARSPVNSPYKGQWSGALVFSLICTRINGWVYNREAGDLRRNRTHYDVIVMSQPSLWDLMAWRREEPEHQLSCYSPKFPLDISTPEKLQVFVSVNDCCHYPSSTTFGNKELTHWGRDKTAAIFQTTFSWIEMNKFRLKLQWRLFPRVQLTIFQHWFRSWLGAGQATS